MPRSSDSSDKSADLVTAIRAAARQEQFLNVVSADEARTRWEAHLELGPLGGEQVSLSGALGRVLATDLTASVDVPPFDRAVVDGFAVRADDTRGASEGHPLRLRLNAEIAACGHPPMLTVAPGTATTIATGGVVPRGADAVVMMEVTELVGAAQPAIDVRRAASPGQFIAYAGSDMARGETVLRRHARIGSREIGMLAACGIATVDVVRRPRVAVLSTGDELVAPGQPLPPAGIYDSNGAIIAAAVAEVGGEPVAYGVYPDDVTAIAAALRRAIDECDLVVLSGGTSKGAGDLSYRVLSTLGPPGLLVHGVALKPGKPLCLAVEGRTPIAVLPGFPTSAIFTFHTFVAPVIRALAGLRAREAARLPARLPVRLASERGRQEFVLVALVPGEDGLLAFPTAKGSGAVTSFSSADGFIEVDALTSRIEAGDEMQVTPIGDASPPDLTIMGSHDVALDVIVGALAERGFAVRLIAVGSTGGLGAAERGECDIAPVHLLDPSGGGYNAHLVKPGLTLEKGWRRMQGVVYRAGDARFAGRSADEAVKAVLADESAVMVNRNAAAGTRVLIDGLLAGARPHGYGNQPRSHNAVAAAVAQNRADWGVAIAPVAHLYGLGFLPLAPEEFDFLIVERRRHRPGVQAFLQVLADPAVRARVRELGMLPFDR